jgi:hypothetical protein
MKAAIACIPDAYMELALASEAWYWFVSTVALVIGGLQALERAMLAIIEHLILWPFIQIRRTVYHSDSLMVEYFSATSAGIVSLWVAFGRENSVAHQLMVQRIPEYIWIALSTVLCLAQFHAAAHGSLSHRGMCCVFGTAFWTFLSLILILRVGFSLAHAFSVPMALACWLAIFMLLAKGGHGSATATDKH